MTRRGIAGLVGLAVVGALAGAVANFPAARAIALAAPERVQAAGVSGSVWTGRAQRLAFGGPGPIEDLQWDIAAWQLVSGRVAGDANFTFAGLDVNGRFAAMPGGAVRITDATFKGPAGPLGQLAPVPVLALDGNVLGRIDTAVIEQQRPRTLQGRVQWQEARVIAPLQMTLGTVRARVEPADDGSHELTIEGSGGEVAIDGRVVLQADGRYTSDIRLTPADDAPQRIPDTLSMVAQRQGDAFVIRRSGRLRR